MYNLSHSALRRAALVCLLLSLSFRLTFGADFTITAGSSNGSVTWANAYPTGVVTLESAARITGPWVPRKNVFTSNSIGQSSVPVWGSNQFVRLLTVDISTNTTSHFTNLVNSYGILETVAGRGQFSGDKVNNWSPTNEGGFATNANLSRPHIAFSDPRNDNIIIVDEGSSGILKVTPDGRIYTYAGTHTNGYNGDGPAAATNLNLYWPNGGWMRADGTFFVLDTYNGKVRKIDTNGIMSTMFTTAPMGDGRALWVKS